VDANAAVLPIDFPCGAEMWTRQSRPCKKIRLWPEITTLASKTSLRLTRDGNNHVARILAINWKDIDDVMDLVPANTLMGKWLRRKGSCGAEAMEPFFEMVSDQGNQL
jgi:hypothetical protein